MRDTALRFAEYAAEMGAVLGDVVEGWITHNEPWVVAFLGHAHGRKAPGIRDWPTALAVSHNLLLSHGLAVDALRATVSTPIGITLNLNPMRGDEPWARGDDGRPPEPLVPRPGAARGRTRPRCSRTTRRSSGRCRR